MCRTAPYSGRWEGKSPIGLIAAGETPDISEYLDIVFFDRVWYIKNAGVGEIDLARFLGVSHTVGSLMSYWILPASGISLSRITVQRVTLLEFKIDEVKDKF